MFLAEPFFPAEEGLCGVITCVGRFVLVGIPMGRKLLIHFIQFYGLAAPVAAAPIVISELIFFHLHRDSVPKRLSGIVDINLRGVF